MPPAARPSLLSRATGRAALHRLAADVAGSLLLGLLWAGTYVLAPVLLLGWQPVLVTGASMTPLVAPGDVLLLADADAGVRQGSLITFRPEGGTGLVTHRVVEVLPQGYRTRGDANAVVDTALVPPSGVVGVGRLLVPALGRPASWLHHGDLVPAALAVGLVAVSALLVLTAPPPPAPAPGRVPALVRSGLLAARSSTALRPVLAAAAAAALVAVPSSAAAAAVVLAGPATAVPTAGVVPVAGPAPACRPAAPVAGPRVRVVPLGPAVPRPERVLGLPAPRGDLRPAVTGPVAPTATFVAAGRSTRPPCRSPRAAAVRPAPQLLVAERPVLGPPVPPAPTVRALRAVQGPAVQGPAVQGPAVQGPAVRPRLAVRLGPG